MDMSSSNDTAADGVLVDKEWAHTMKPVLGKYKHAKTNNLLLMVNFVTVKDYLFLLRMVACLMAPLKQNALFYLAAAVSDFYIPDHKMAKHKIQSDDGPLTLQLDRVPKMLGQLVKEWAPDAFIISFKLETDPSILLAKSTASLNRYGHQLVIGNILTTRKHKVVFVSHKLSSPRHYPKQASSLSLLDSTINGPSSNDHSRFDIQEITLSQTEMESGMDIETKMIQQIMRLHAEWIQNAQLLN